MSKRLFIKVNPELDEDEKTLELADDLGLDIDLVTGKLLRLWSWAFIHAEDGDLSDLTPRRLALIMRLPGDTGDSLLESLRSCGFLDGWQIHSWADWGGALYHERAKDAERKAAKDAQEDSTGIPPEFHRNSTRAKRGELREESEEQEQDQEITTPKEQELLPPLVRLARTIPGWKSRADDGETFKSWSCVYSARQIERTTRELLTYQAGLPASKRYKDPRLALGKWLKREEPETCDTLGTVVGQCPNCGGDLRRTDDAVTSCQRCGPGQWVSQCYGPSVWRPDEEEP